MFKCSRLEISVRTAMTCVYIVAQAQVVSNNLIS